MSEWKEGIWLAASALLVTVFLMFMNTIGTAIGTAARIEQSDTDNVEVLKEYYKIGRYDDVVVTRTDVVNCIVGNRTQVPVVTVSLNPAPDVVNPPFPSSTPFPPGLPYPTNPPYPLVTPPPGTSFVGYYLWDGTKWNSSNVYSTAALDACVPPGATYRAKLVKNANGEVLYIWFRRIT